MNVLAFTKYDRLGASSRLRTIQYIPFLEMEGISVDYVPLFQDNYIKTLYEKKSKNYLHILLRYFLRIMHLFRCRQYDVIWIEKELFPGLPAIFERILNIINIKYIIDFDDAIFHNYDQSKSFWFKILKNKIKVVMRNSSLVVCGNEYLKSYAQSAQVKRVEVIPTVISLDKYKMQKKNSKKSIAIGWIGSPSTVKYIKIVENALNELSEKYDFKLIVIGAEFISSKIIVECIKWTEDKEVDLLQKIDIGIMPLLDSLWERGKCGYKLIQYMGCGIPVVASPIGINNNIVVDGINGFLAKDNNAWVIALEKLVKDEELRAELGKRGRELVEEKYSISVQSKRLANFLLSLNEGKYGTKAR